MLKTPARLVLLICALPWAVACGDSKPEAPSRPPEAAEATRQPLVLQGMVPRDLLSQATQARVVVAVDPKGGIVSEARLPSQKSGGKEGRTPFNLARIGEGHPRYFEGTDTSVWFGGAEHIFEGTIDLDGWRFESSADFPLTFKVVPKQGYTYLCGKGKVTTPAGNSWTLGEGETVAQWLGRSRSAQQLEREAAAQALGHLARGAQAAERSQAVARLQELLGDAAFEVRRDALEALAVLKATEARASIDRLAQGEPDAWVRETAAWAAKQL